MEKDLTTGPIARTMLLFAIPMILGNLLQQVYNITDTIIVGRFIGADALAAVGSAYTLMTFLISVIIGLCMGCGALFSMFFGAKKDAELAQSIRLSFRLILLVTVLIYIIVFSLTDVILQLLQTPQEIYGLMRQYVRIIFIGIGFTFLYNFFAFVLRAIGNSMLPLVFLAISSGLNIALDLWFVIGLGCGVGGAAAATVIAQAVSGVGLTIFSLRKLPKNFSRISSQRYPARDQSRENFKTLANNISGSQTATANSMGKKLTQIPRQRFCPPVSSGISTKKMLRQIAGYAFFTCMQQSVMNFGILMIQGLVNSFGVTIMAAFAAAVKIDTLAYMPAQEFANAFSLFLSQNHGAGQTARIRKGIRCGICLTVLFCAVISVMVCIFAKPLMMIFVDASENAILAEGVKYLRIEGAFYWGIGCLFLLYGLYRAIEKPYMSLVLTIISLGTRVFLAYLLAPRTPLGETAIWMAIPIGWMLADLTGLLYYKRKIQKANSTSQN